MKPKSLLESWKYPSILLFGIGVSNVGDWIYLIALNLIVLDMTGSPLAVSILYILKPLATLFTNGWAGSVIDRLNKRNLMIGLDVFRAFFIAILPILPTVWAIYSLVFIINMASSMFEPTSMTYITKLIPRDQRRRFNSLRSLIDSGGFLIGPAIAGLMFMNGTPFFAIYMTAIAIFISGLITTIMPNLEKGRAADIEESKFSLNLLKRDWQVVSSFSKAHVFTMTIYLLFGCMMVMATAIDSLEAAFAKEVLSLTDSKYGFLVSIAGAGIAVGASVNAVFAKKFTTSMLLGFGTLLVSVGYIIYAFSSTFIVAAIGFFVLSFFLAFANAGFHTFYQNNIPVEVMGRVGSVYGLIEAFLIIVVTALFGFAAQLISIKLVVIIGTLMMLVVTLVMFVFNLQSSKFKFTSTEP
ncbi:MFS transporter [Alkalibacillus salilacus]|uniref:MFS family permease n=1 Tax=Alkalibacillus salilacus TaxID=284582 RepID=A0ABT9VIC9_9BACI|nr:MFS transporter [Alkalibacillus salilacus]MDQ0160637.1 MFS family permease [Alkalibacillus salilacus]